MSFPAVSLDDKYTVEEGRVFLNGTQALIRLPMMQRQRDLAAGLNTASFISGYRGSPLGGLDLELWKTRRLLDENHIRFVPGVNEDLAATAIWGTQQIGLFPDANYDGVFSMWYGKGPGVDRSGDVLKHANAAGTAPHGGVLLLAGDDHTAKSSTLPHQSEYALIDASIPVLNPADVQDFLDLGLYGWALSRYSGCWVGFKTISETVETSASAYVDPQRIQIVLPDDFDMPPGGLNIRLPDTPIEQEARLHTFKLEAARAFVRANKLDRTIIDGPARRYGIVTTGKSYLDVRQALADLGIDDATARRIGLSVYKVAMSWPLEPQGLRAFAEGLEEILVVEEKRGVMEEQIKTQLFNMHADRRPRIIGKYDDRGNWILPSPSELTPGRIARVLAERISGFHTSDQITRRLAFLDAIDKEKGAHTPSLQRIPYFCSGCPHNTSTRVPEGSRAMAGIGCHYMAQWMDRDTATSTQMGGEGATWIGMEPFVKTEHVFQNLGDGTYFHSGILAVRAAVAAKVAMTYKLLYNDAVAMTGGQPVDGSLTVPEISRQLHAEGVERIAIVSDEPNKYPVGASFAPGVTFHHRDELDPVQRDLRQWPGVSVLIYDQTCAAEKRRRRKRGLMIDPPRRVFINEEVCEGCGDCNRKSNCLSVTPVETEFGRKRAIDQSSCNKDYSCVNGFCPSFVTVEGGTMRKRQMAQATMPADALPDPELPSVDEPYGILVTGIGGTGVLTIGALVGMAAHIEGKGVTVLDMAGLAQKGGAVLSHLRISRSPEDIHAVRLASGSAKLLLGCDLVVAAGDDALSKVQPGVTRAIINSHMSITGDFTRHPDMPFPTGAMEKSISDVVGREHTDLVAATEIATALIGDSIATNIFMLGYAYQKGLIPVSAEAIEHAIEINGVAVPSNLDTFRWGRRAAHSTAAVAALIAPETSIGQDRKLSASLDETVGRRLDFLRRSRNWRTATRYNALVDRARAAEQGVAQGRDALSDAVARSFFKLLSYKDEYEVARLYSDGEFMARLKDQFEGNVRLTFHLAPPLLAARDENSGHLKKKTFGPWMLGAFKVLARLKFLRGTPFDIFGYSAERRMERRLIEDYEQIMDSVLADLTMENYGLAVEIAQLPQSMRGFGHVKDANVEAALQRQDELLAAFRNPAPARSAAE